jgi:hypothetical protein
MEKIKNGQDDDKNVYQRQVNIEEVEAKKLAKGENSGGKIKDYG